MDTKNLKKTANYGGFFINKFLFQKIYPTFAVPKME